MRSAGGPCAVVPAGALSPPRRRGRHGGALAPWTASRRSDHKACTPAKARRAIMDNA